MSSGIYWLASYPKSGNTWLRIFLNNLLANRNEPVNINELQADSSIASSRSWIDEVLGFDSADLTDNEIECLRPAVYRWSLQDEKVLYCKIHDAYTYTPDGEPLVSREATLGGLYLLRNPLDIAVSLAAHWQCSIDQAIQAMGCASSSAVPQKKRLHFQVQQKLLSWSDHVTSWVDAEGLNREVIRYEDMKAKPLETFSRAAVFLGLPAEPERIEKALRFSAFNELQQQETTTGFKEIVHPNQRFFRKGIVGDWKHSLTEPQVQKIIADHFEIMQRFGYIDEHENPVEEV